jgi:hypothetical protein
MAHHQHHHDPPLAAKPQPMHSDQPLGPRLASIINHSYCRNPANQTAYALQVLKQQHWSGGDLKRLLTAAYADEATLPELKAMIADYLIVEWWPSKAGAEETDQEPYNDASDAGLDGFPSSMQLLLNLRWSPTEIAEQELNSCDADLDPAMIEEI